MNIYAVLILYYWYPH